MTEEQERLVPGGATPETETASELKEVVEAMLFASDDPVTPQTLRVVFDEMNREQPGAPSPELTPEVLRSIVEDLNSEYAAAQRAFRIQALAGGYVFATEKKFATWVGKMLREKARRKLSQTAVETLAIIAYKQPITKSEVEFIRGVNADYIMKTLLEKNLASIVGRAHSPGRPLLYGTTPEFLKHFGLNEISDLPRPREIEELLGETEREVEKRMLASQQEMEFKDKLQEKLDPNSRAPHIPRKKSKLQEPSKDQEGSTVVAKSPLVLPRVPEMNEATSEVPAEEIRAAEIPPEPELEALPQSLEQAPEPVGQIEVDAQSPAISEPSETESQIAQIPFIPPSPEPAMTEPAAIEAALPKKGWSTWKTKIQTFFRKLFG